MQLIFEKSRKGRRAIRLDALDVPEAPLPADFQRKEDPALPEVGELDVVRHFTHLSKRNFSIDANFYPLGSCTMKYNPKMAEAVASDRRYASLHPHLSSAKAYWPACQGAFALMHDLAGLLAEIAGMKEVTLQPIAGAHGELTGTLLIAAYHREKGNTHKDTIIIPDSAHGTNPASAALAGYKVVEVPSDKDGAIHIEKFREVLNDKVAGIMLTCPNTHGLFEKDIRAIADAAHEVDALLYYDGANLNAIMGRSRPGDMGFDVMHFNLHKTFATPHGMGGPGSGPVGVGERLQPFLPGPQVVKEGEGYGLRMPEKSIGPMAAFFGNFMMAVRAYAYIRLLGSEGLQSVSDHAVLHANYIHSRLKGAFGNPFAARCMHECVLSAAPQTKNGVHAVDIAKALLDYGLHAPTVYFPLTVKESMMIEPTETESKETMDQFCDVMLELAGQAKKDPEPLKQAPRTMPVGRLDEVRAAKELNCSV
ncbi:MAG: aminomethyl-transferring glycine dehydrogenase subunit GcvPB [Candidatus Hydrogenedentota bacterium]